MYHLAQVRVTGVTKADYASGGWPSDCWIWNAARSCAPFAKNARDAQTCTHQTDSRGINLPLQGRGLAARSVAKHSCRAQHAAPLRLILVVRRRACDTLRENFLRCV